MMNDRILSHKLYQQASILVVAALVTTGLTSSAFADDIWRKPAVKQGAIGAAAGAAVGVMSDRTSVGKGAATGAAVGVGTGLMTQSRFFKDKPLLRNTAQGAVIGTGASYATGRSKTNGAVLGAGSGAGYHYVRKFWNRR
ncbi:YMGG-like glycine zipper-containing protein [Vampirovibrio sp.]|uniref:YMGG-like glycine zipper-containing protein n=1 Tax=Vampirovibrio sp. TaxID=2717857 RepID=UPI0035943A2A